MRDKLKSFLITEDIWNLYLFKFGKGEIKFPFNYLFLPLFWYGDIKNKMGWYIR